MATQAWSYNADEGHYTFTFRRWRGDIHLGEHHANWWLCYDGEFIVQGEEKHLPAAMERCEELMMAQLEYTPDQP